MDLQHQLTKHQTNCVQVMLFYGHKGQLAEKMAEACKCELQLAMDFINKDLHFLTESCDTLDQSCDSSEPKSQVDEPVLPEPVYDPKGRTIL